MDTQIIPKQQLIFGLLFFLAGVIISYNTSPWGALILTPFLYKMPKLYIGFFAIGILSVFVKIQNLKHPVILEKTNAEIYGYVSKLYFKNGGLRAIISDVQCHSCALPAPKKLIATFRKTQPINLQTKLRIEGQLIPLPPRVFPNYYDVEIKNRFRNIGGYISVKKYETIKEANGFLNRIRSRVLSVFSVLPASEEGLATALFLGDKGKMTREEYALFKKAGLAHVLAISGLHISIISILVFGIFWRFFALFPFSLRCDTKKIAGCIAIFAGLLFLTLAGMPISGVRSYIMMLFLFGSFFFKVMKPERSLVFAAILILIFAPEELFFPSFQLSFISVLCLIKGYKTQSFHGKRKVFGFMLGTLISSALVSIITIPLVAHHFNYIHLYGVISNVFAIPLLSIFIMPLGLLAIITGAPFIISCFSYSLKTIFWIAKIVADLPLSSLFLNYFSGELLAIFTLGIILFFYVKKNTGFIFIAFSFIAYFITSKAPLIVFNEDYVVIKSGENYISLFYIPDGFLKDVWQEKLNTQFISFKNDGKYEFTCAQGACFHPKFTLIYQDVRPRNCTGEILININSDNNACNFKKALTVKDIKKDGVIAI